MGAIAGGWQVNGILTYQSGTPVQISYNNNLPLFNGANRPNSIIGVPIQLTSKSNFDPAKNLLLNVNTFSDPLLLCV